MTGFLVATALFLAAPQANDPELARRLFSQAFDRHAELDMDSSLVLLRAARDADLSRLPVHLEYILTILDRLPDGLTRLRAEYAGLPDSPLIRCLRAYVAVSHENLPKAFPALMDMDKYGDGGGCPAVLLAGIVGELKPTRVWESRRQDYLERALALEPELNSLWTSYASALGSVGRIEEAEEVLTRAASAAWVHPLQRIRINMRRAGLMRSRGDTASADALWRAVQVAVQRDGRPGMLLIYLRALDSVLDTRNTPGNELDVAIYQSADLARSYGAWVYEFYARYTLAMRLTDRGEPLAALPHYDRIVQIADSVGIARYQTRAYYKRGRALSSIGHFTEAESDLLRAVDVGVDAESDYYLAEAYHNLFHLYDGAGRLSEATRAVDNFVQAGRPLRHSPLRMTALLDAGEIRWKLGWHAAADEAFSAAIAVVDEYDEYHNYAGEYFERTGDLESAREYYERGVAAAGKSAISVRSQSLAGLTRIFLAMGQLDSAEVYARAHDEAMTESSGTLLLPEILTLKGEFTEAIHLAESWTRHRIAGGSVQAICTAYLRLADLLIRAGDPIRALPVLVQADSLALEANLVEERIESARLMGLALAARGDTTRALAAMRDAADEALLHATTVNIRQTHTELGNLLVATGRLDEALAAFETAAEQVTSTTASLHIDFDRVRYRGVHLDPFDGAIEALLTLPADRGRNMSLLRWSARRKAAALPESTQGVITDRANTMDWSTDHMLDRLEQDHAFIDYLVSGDGVRALVGLKGRLSLHTIPISIDSIASLTSRLLAPLVAITGGRIDMARVRFDYAAAHELYRALWEPLLPAMERANRITVIPDGPLHRIPFVTLVSDTGLDEEGRTSSALRFVLDDYEISYALSTRHLGSADRFSGLGTDKPAKILVVTYRAPGGEGEVQSIIDAWPRGRVHTLIGDEATESRVRQVEQSYDIVHYATHAFANGRDPLASYIGLASDSDSDGLYHLSEIAGQPHDQALVILSGCETQTGNLFRGEGLMGLTRAYLASGARAVVATQWPVSAVAASLMGEFHRRLAAGTSPATALRAAQLKLRADPANSHPFYWAGLVLHRRD